MVCSVSLRGAITCSPRGLSREVQIVHMLWTARAPDLPVLGPSHQKVTQPQEVIWARELNRPGKEADQDAEPRWVNWTVPPAGESEGFPGFIGTTIPQLGWTQSCISTFAGLVGDWEDLEFRGLSWQCLPEPGAG